MDSVSIKTIRKIAEAYDHQLLANDPRFQREATIIFDDGTFLHYKSAFLLRIKHEWIAVFTEHHGWHIYHEDELSGRWESERRRIPIEELSNGS